MAILLDNKEITDFANTTESVNVLSYKSIDVIQDDIFVITTHNNQTFLKEKKGDWKSKPVVEFNIHTGNALHRNVRFVLEKSTKSLLNFSKFGVARKADRKVVVENKTAPQLVTNKPAPVVAPPTVSEDVLKQHIQSTILQMLTDDSSDKFSKFFDVYTESLKRDMMKYSEKIARRETYRVMESGGGTNAVQYADGGVMNGNLTVNGDIHTNNFTGHVSLSSLNQDGAADGQVLTWNDTYQQWIPVAASGGATFKLVTYIGNGVDTTFTVNHDLNSVYLIHQVYDSTTFEVVNPHIQNTDDNNTVVSFSFVPAASAYTLVTMY